MPHPATFDISLIVGAIALCVAMVSLYGTL
jgi:hypothetical protein